MKKSYSLLMQNTHGPSNTSRKSRTKNRRKWRRRVFKALMKGLEVLLIVLKIIFTMWDFFRK